MALAVLLLAPVSVLADPALRGAVDQLAGGVSCEPAGNRVGIEGTVVDLLTGIPLDRATVTVIWDEAGARHPAETSVVTSEGGRFSLCDLPAATTLRIRAQFVRSQSRTLPVVLEAGDVRTLEFEVDAPRIPVSGQVTQAEGGAPISGARISLGYQGTSAISGSDGRFVLNTVPPGTYTFTASHLAYGDVSGPLAVEPGTRAQLSVTMDTEAILLEAIRVELRSILLEESGFYDRMERGFGAFLTRAQIQERIPLYASDILRGVAGVRMVPSRDRAGSVPVDRSECPYRYVLNGARVGEGFRIDDIPADWIDAVEIYRGVATVPHEFQAVGIGARANCGVIVIWTRNTGW